MLEMYYLGKMFINCIVRDKNDTVSLNKIYETLNLKYPDFKYIDEEYQDIDVAINNAMKDYEKLIGSVFSIEFKYRKYNMLTVLKYILYSHKSIDEIDEETRRSLEISVQSISFNN